MVFTITFRCLQTSIIRYHASQY